MMQMLQTYSFSEAYSNRTKVAIHWSGGTSGRSIVHAKVSATINSTYRMPLFVFVLFLISPFRLCCYLYGCRPSSNSLASDRPSCILFCLRRRLVSLTAAEWRFSDGPKIALMSSTRYRPCCLRIVHMPFVYINNMKKRRISSVVFVATDLRQSGVTLFPSAHIMQIPLILAPSAVQAGCSRSI